MELNERTSKHNYYSFLWHAVFLALASNFMDVDTIIPAMMLDAGGTPVQLGMLTAIMLGGGRIAQLFFAPFLQNKHLKKRYLLSGINGRMLALAGMSVLFFLSSRASSSLTILVIFCLISLFTLGGAFANINYVDILGKSILKDKRKSFFSLKHVISNVFVLVSAFFARKVLQVYSYPDNYAMLFLLAAVLLGIASFGFWRIKEIPVKSIRIDGVAKFVRIIAKEFRDNKKLRNYLFIINTQGIAITLMPFLILYAKQTYNVESHDIGNYLLLKVIGGILTGSTLYYFSGQIRYHYMMYVTSSISIIIPLIMIIAPGKVLFPYFFMIGGIIFTIYSISMNGILLEVTTNENRALYTGLSGAGGILPVMFPFLGGWIISQFSFRLFFVIFAVIILSSLYFIQRINCQK